MGKVAATVPRNPHPSLDAMTTLCCSSLADLAMDAGSVELVLWFFAMVTQTPCSETQAPSRGHRARGPTNDFVRAGKQDDSQLSALKGSAPAFPGH